MLLEDASLFLVTTKYLIPTKHTSGNEYPRPELCIFSRTGHPYPLTHPPSPQLPSLLPPPFHPWR